MFVCLKNKKSDSNKSDFFCRVNLIVFVLNYKHITALYEKQFQQVLTYM